MDWPVWSKWYKRILLFLSILAGVMIMGVTLLICLDVFMRSVFNSGQSWVVEISENLLVFMVFLGAAWVLKDNGHVSVDILYIRLGKKQKQITEILIAAMGLFTCVIMTWRGIDLSLDNFHRGVLQVKTIAWPMWVLFGIISFGFLMLSIEFVRKLFVSLMSLIKQDKTAITENKKISEVF